MHVRASFLKKYYYSKCLQAVKGEETSASSVSYLYKELHSTTFRQMSLSLIIPWINAFGELAFPKWL